MIAARIPPRPYPTGLPAITLEPKINLADMGRQFDPLGLRAAMTTIDRQSETIQRLLEAEVRRLEAEVRRLDAENRRLRQGGRRGGRPPR